MHISLRYISPKIRRRLLVPANISLQDFHKVIQSSMGWWNSHLHQFIKGEKFYLEKTEDDDFWEDKIHVDYLMLKLSDLLKKEKDEIGYEYDFGDGWLHNIVLEKIPVSDPGVNNPQCTAGKRNCPPEDCGGPFGYSNLLTVISNPRHEEYEEMMKWTGGNFDPESFDKETINDLLKKEDFGIVPFRLC
ncbi:MAG: plasmid pRiA4b ORF-3 family protein [Bacteroidetes bacterium]|nr:plasmid pRiA4b ORF-3 family protein [Bacteroidota bacterium]